MTVLSDLVEAIETRLQAATSSSVPIIVGRLDTKSNIVAKTRIVVTRSTSPVDAGSRIGGNIVGSARIRQRYLRHETTSWHIFAADDDSAETLLDTLLWVGREICGTSWVPGSYEWETDREDVADYALRGPKVRLDVVVLIPVTDESKALTTITTITHTGKLDDEQGC